YKNLATRLCVADVEYSAFYQAWVTGDMTVTCPRPSRIEGVGRPRVEPSFVPGAIDHMMRVPDAASIAAAQVLSERLFRRVGGSTGTNFYALCRLAAGMIRERREGSLVTLICDSGDRYASTYFNADWLKANEIDTAPYRAVLERFLDTGEFAEP